MHIFRVLSASLLLLSALSCTDTDPSEPPIVSIPEACRTATRVQSGSITNAVWRKGDGPHVVRDSVVVTGSLTIEAGSVICARPSAGIRVAGAGAALLVNGSATESVTFAASDTAQPWSGITARDGASIQIGHATIEHATSGISASGCSSIEIENVRVRQSGTGITVTQPCSLTVRRSVLDTIAGTAIGSYLAPSPTGHPRDQTSQLQAILEDNVVHKAARGIVLVGWNGEITINGGRIEDVDEGFILGPGNDRHVGDAIRVTSARPLRILGATKSVSATVEAVSKIWPRAHRDSLVGNVQDTVVVHGAYAGELIVTKRVPVRHTKVAGFLIPWTEAIERVTVDAGATFIFEDRATIGTLTVNGTAAEPATIYGAWFDVGCADGPTPECTRWAADTSHLKHARLIMGGAPAGFSRPTIGDSLQITGAGGMFGFGGAGSRLTNSTVSGFSTLALGDGVRLSGVVIRGMRSDGVWISGSDITLSNCAVIDNNGGGVRIFNGSNIRINDCNIERNTGFGVRNDATQRVDARRNWWGDPQGPLGPNGGGVIGDVDYSAYRTTPMPLSAKPPLS